MRFLIACLHHRQSTGRSLYNALGRLGHDVRHVGGYLHDADREGPYAWKALGDWDHGWRDWTPHVVIYADTVWPAWRHPYYDHIPHAHVCSCNNVVNMRGGPWERHFLAARYGPAWAVEQDDEEWMPCGYSPRWHTPSTIPYEQRVYDVAMIGRMDERRERCLDALRAAGLRVFTANGIWFEEYAAAYHNARMSLCTNDQQSGMKRYFESAAMGNLILGDDCQGIADLGGADCMVQIPGLPEADAVDALVERARYYAANPDAAQTLIDRALVWSADHRWDDRAMQIVQWAERIG